MTGRRAMGIVMALTGVLASMLAVMGDKALAADPNSDRESLELGYLEFSPFYATGPKGQAEGLLIELATEVLGKLGKSWHATAYPAARLMENLKNGTTQLAMLIKHPALRNSTIYGQTPVAVVRLQAYWSGDKVPITTKADLAGKSIIILRGYGYSGWIDFIQDPQNKVRYSVADDHDGAFMMLNKGRADYVLDYKSPAEQSFKKITVPNLRQSLVQEFDVYFIVSKVVPDAILLSARIDAVLNEAGQ